LVLLTYIIVCHHSSVSLNKEKICHEISEDKIAVCKKTQGLRSGNFSDLNSACSKVLLPVKIFQFRDMHSTKVNDMGRGKRPNVVTWQNLVRLLAKNRSPIARPQFIYGYSVYYVTVIRQFTIKYLWEILFTAVLKLLQYAYHYTVVLSFHEY
jgi:hypothetical protein